MRRLALICLSVFMVFIAVLGLVLAVLKSESGSEWIFRQITARVLPGELAINGIQGDLISGLTIDDVTHKFGKQQILLHQIRLSCAPLALFTGRLHIKSLDIETIACTLPEDLEPIRDGLVAGLADLPVYAEFSADRIRVSNVIINATSHRFEMRKFNLKTSLGGNRLVVEGFEGLFDRSQFGLTGEVHLSLPISYAGRFRWRSPLTEALDTAGKGSFNGNADHLTMDIVVREPFPILTSGTLKWGSNGLTFSSLQPSALNASDEKEETGQVNGLTNDLPWVLQFDQLKAMTWRGLVTVDGRLAWHDEPEWDLSLSADQINPASRFPDWPGELDIAATVQGRLTNGAHQITIPHFRIQGRLLDQPIDAVGHVDIAGERLSAADLRIVSGENTMTLSAGRAIPADLAFGFVVLDPYSLWPPVKGTFIGSGTVGHAYDNPRVSLRVDGTQIKYAAASIKNIGVEAEISIADSLASTASVKVSEIQLGDVRYPSLSVFGSGNFSHLEMAGTILSTDAQFDFNFSGDSPDISWEFTVDSASLASAEYGEWGLFEPVSIRLEQDKMAPIRVCWAQGQVSRCIDAQWHIDSGLKIENDREVPPMQFLSIFFKTLLDSRYERLEDDS